MDAQRESNLSRQSWVNVALAAVLMAATLPGRTQGMGLVTEPLLKDLHIDRLTYAGINLWATLLGAAFCLPVGYLIDRFGVRLVSILLLLSLGLTVYSMSVMVGGIALLFLLVTLTRGLGQSALSVASITAAGRSSGRRPGLAMGVYSALLTILMAIAFGLAGNAVSTKGWRTAWFEVAGVLAFFVAPLTLFFLRGEAGTISNEGTAAREAKNLETTEHFNLRQALQTRAFWIFGGATALFGFVSSGLGLFNEAVLAELGFGADTFHTFLVVTTLVSLLGQLLCGWLALRWPLRRLMAVAMFLYALALGILTLTRTSAELWLVAILMGGAAGIVMVTFFAVWSQTFGRKHLGRIQGAAQLITVLASAVGPLLFAQCFAVTGSYAPLLKGLVPAVLLVGFAAWKVPMPSLAGVLKENTLAGSTIS